MPPPLAVLAEAEQQGRVDGAAHRRRQRRAGRHAVAHVQEDRSQPPGVAGGGGIFPPARSSQSFVKV